MNYNNNKFWRSNNNCQNNCRNHSVEPNLNSQQSPPPVYTQQYINSEFCEPIETDHKTSTLDSHCEETVTKPTEETIKSCKKTTTQPNSKLTGKLNELLSGIPDLSNLKFDADTLIIIALMVALYHEGADIKLVLALGYILL